MARELPLLGFGLPVAGPWATPEAIARVATRAEALGYASLWTFQRILHPVASELSPPHLSVLDSVATLAYAAAHTERIGLGTATVCALLTPPALLAKSMTSLDVLSGGRLTVGLGMGWLPEEYAAAGVPFERRGARMDEYLRCLTAVWTQDPVEFAGEFYTVPRSHVGPPPVQRPHPPILLGGTAGPALRRAGSIASGWIASSLNDGAEIAPSVEALRAAARAAGRDPGALRIVARGVVGLVADDLGFDRRLLAGTSSQVFDDLEAMHRKGVTEVIIDLNLAPRVGFPDADPGPALDYALHVLDTFAPRNPG
ncbi:MAG: TIGR03619 family F420-dependent LLM class oxidoreductase [Acidimicrobiales bacterium]